MRFDRIFSKLHGSKLFTTLDVRSGYYNITVAEGSGKYTASTTEYGTYKFFPTPLWYPWSPQLFHIND